MSRKNFKVATAENGETTLVKIDKTPTGKVKTLKDKEQIRKEREEQYKNFRIGALRRRGKRLKLPEEEIEKKVKELLVQMDTPNSYDVLILFSTKDENMVVQALKKEGLVWKMKSSSHLFIEADQETLKTLREIMPPSAKIHPYVKKKPTLLPIVENKSEKKPKKGGKPHSRLNGKQEKRKRYNVARFSKKKKADFKKEVKSLKDIWKANKKMTGKVVQFKPKKRSTGSKKASTDIKKAA